MDIISSLPDDILCDFCSFPPMKYAVATGILSTQWKYLWASVPILDFDSRPCQDLYSILNMNTNHRSVITFQNFVSRVLLLHDMPNIRKFRLIFECHYRSAPICTWLHVAISDNIQDLELDFFWYVRYKLVDLPKNIFTSSMLVVLKLSRMPLKVPSVVYFPSLKILELRRIIYLHDDCIQNLISGCQVLEELGVEEIAREKPKVVDISIHTLRSFSFTYRFVVDVMVDWPNKFIINAPNLEYFHVKGHISDVFEVSDLSSLNNARVDLHRAGVTVEVYSIFHQRIFGLLEGISKAKSITLSGEIVDLLSEAFDQSLPRFSDLAQLAFGIGFDFGWKRILTKFIKCSSSLDALTLNNKQGILWDMDDLNKIPAQPLPSNLLSHLKNIMIDELYANFIPEYVEYLMQHINI